MQAGARAVIWSRLDVNAPAEQPTEKSYLVKRCGAIRHPALWQAAGVHPFYPLPAYPLRPPLEAHYGYMRVTPGRYQREATPPARLAAKENYFRMT